MINRMKEIEYNKIHEIDFRVATEYEKNRIIWESKNFPSPTNALTSVEEVLEVAKSGVPFKLYLFQYMICYFNYKEWDYRTFTVEKIEYNEFGNAMFIFKEEPPYHLSDYNIPKNSYNGNYAFLDEESAKNYVEKVKEYFAQRNVQWSECI